MYPIIVFFLLSVGLFAQNQMLSCPAATVGCAIPAAYSWAITKTAGNWIIAGTGAAGSQAATATTTQAINVATMAANWFMLSSPTVTTTTACAGITVITLTGIGVTGSATLFAAAQ